MLRITTLLTVALLALQLHAAPPETNPSFAEWDAACAKLPSNRELKNQLPDLKLLPLQDYGRFEAVMDAYLKLMQESAIAKQDSWVEGIPDFASFFSLEQNYYRENKLPFQPFAEKLSLPAGSKLIIQGDLHGDIRSLLHSLKELQKRGIMEGFKVTAPEAHLCFTGDFTDRGKYGTEVIYTLLRLKLASPGNVHFARGNHEDFRIFSRYGFLEELRGKYGQDINITKLVRIFDLMPAVIYIGTESDYVQMNHGGMEPGYDPRPLLASTGTQRYQLLGELRQKTFHQQHKGWLGDDLESQEFAESNFRDYRPQSITSPHSIGFLWNDFTVFQDDPALSKGRPYTFGMKPTQYLLKNASTQQHRVRAVMRGHQHSSTLNPLMRRLVACGGVCRHWQDNDHRDHADASPEKLASMLESGTKRPVPDGSVWTFNVSPDSVYGIGCKYDFATYGILSLDKDFAKWSMEVLKMPLF